MERRAGAVLIVPLTAWVSRAEALQAARALDLDRDSPAVSQIGRAALVHQVSSNKAESLSTGSYGLVRYSNPHGSNSARRAQQILTAGLAIPVAHGL